MSCDQVVYRLRFGIEATPELLAHPNFRPCCRTSSSTCRPVAGRPVDRQCGCHRRRDRDGRRRCSAGDDRHHGDRQRHDEPSGHQPVGLDLDGDGSPTIRSFDVRSPPTSTTRPSLGRSMSTTRRSSISAPSAARLPDRRSRTIPRCPMTATGALATPRRSPSTSPTASRLPRHRLRATTRPASRRRQARSTARRLPAPTSTT